MLYPVLGDSTLCPQVGLFQKKTDPQYKNEWLPKGT